MRAKPNLVRVILDSCNPVSLRRDLARLLGGGTGPDDDDRGGFVLEQFRSFDFFAGTPHMVSICSLVRRRRTLILPVGGCGVGKSSFAAALKQAAGPACGLSVFERDAVFASHRGHALSADCPWLSAKLPLAPSSTAGSVDLADDAEDSAWGEAELLAEIERVWDRCGRCGPNGTARRLATLMHAVQSSSPEAAAAIGKPSSKWFQQRPSLFVLKAVKGGQQVVTRAAEVVERRQQQEEQEEGLDARRKHCGKAAVFG